MYISIRPDLGPKRQQEKLLSSSENLGILDVRIDLIREAKDVEEAINPVVPGRWSAQGSRYSHLASVVEGHGEAEVPTCVTSRFTIPFHHPRVEIVTERAQASTCAALTLSTRAGVSPGARPVHWGLDEAKTRGGLVECVTEASRYRGKKSGVRSMRSWILARKGPEIEYAVDAQGDDVERPSIIFMRRMAA
ncbi:hypothetical protein E4U12_004459 [Claviceps purpurea]|nr:hypothetical protein E4U12_004459 [Claviceps purpurea]